MKIAKKKIFGGWLIAFVILLGLSSVAALAEGTPVAIARSKRLTFDTNEILLNEMTREMNELLIQIEAIHQRGGLPAIDLPLGIRIETFDLLRGFMNGINIPLLVNIGGIGSLNEALFSYYMYSPVLAGNLRFPYGILNGSNTINNQRLPQQTLQAHIAAQEYLLYVSDAIRGALRLILLMDMDENSVDIIDMLSGARSFLAFNMNELNQRRDTMYRQFGHETVRIGGRFRGVTRNVSDIVRDADGEGYNLLINLRNFLLGGQENVTILIDVLGYAERMVNGEILEKYSYIDFENADSGVDQMLSYLTADAIEVRHVLSQLDRLTEPFATLLNEAEGEIMELAFSQIPDFLEFFVPGLFDDIDGVEDVVAYLDTVISVLGEMRVGMQGISLNEGRRFVTDTLSGEILNRYLVLEDTSDLQTGDVLRYLKDDLDSVIAVLEIIDLVDQEFVPLLGGVYLSDVVKGHLIVIAPDIINTQLDLLITDFGDLDIDVDISELGVGEMAVEILEPAILNFNISEVVDDLRSHSASLTRLIPIGERIDQMERLVLRTLPLY